MLFRQRRNIRAKFLLEVEDLNGFTKSNRTRLPSNAKYLIHRGFEKLELTEQKMHPLLERIEPWMNLSIFPDFKKRFWIVKICKRTIYTNMHTHLEHLNF